MSDKRLFLLDAYALIFRAYYALIRMPRITRAGFNTSAVFGFVNTLEELLRKERPTHIAVCFDPSGPTFRKEAYDRYKAERESTPEDIRLSVPIIKEIVRAYNIPLVEVDGYEADDVIGTLAKRAEKKGFTVYMMTPDKDFGQLVSPSVLQYKPSYRGQDFELRGEEEVCARYGIDNTRQVIDLLALMGDKVDNIPGCPGVGEKTAVKLIKEFGSVENLIENTGSLKGALRKKVEENAEEIKFSKFLATIRTDVPIDIDASQLELHPVDRDKLFAIFRELEFKTLAERVARRLDAAEGMTSAPEDNGSVQTPDSYAPGASETSEEPQHLEKLEKADGSPAEYLMVDSEESLRRMREALQSASETALFIYAEGENDMGAEYRGVAVAPAPGEAYYVPVAPALTLFDEPDPVGEEALALILDTMTRGDLLKVTANAKRDYVIASRLRTDKAPALVNFYDIGLAHYVVQPETRHTVDALASTYLHFDPLPQPVAQKQSGRRQATPVSPAAVAEWACQQADLTLRLRAPLEENVKREGMEKLLYEMEFPLVEVLASMEIAGVRLDVSALNAAAAEMEERLRVIESEVYEMAGTEFNIGSPARVGEILFDRLQLDAKAKKTKTGQYSTSEDVLEKLVDKHPVVGKILEWRALKKLLSTYLTALPAAINPVTGKVHTNYNQTVTATGRLSSSAPNLQNIPVREEEGRGIRKAFIADKGCLFLSADYSQIELRLMADFSGDPIMLEAFREGRDIHAITAGRIFGKPADEVNQSERRKAKTANFGIIYGISPFGLATRLGIPRAEAKEIIDNYFATFPGVRKYMDESIEHAREKGYVVTRMGRKRLLPDINSRNQTVRGYAERNAINAPLQGTAADIIKMAMISIFREMKERGLRSKMIMQVHDELNFNVVADELPQMQEIVERGMQEAYSGRVKLTASCGVGENWLEAH